MNNVEIKFNGHMNKNLVFLDGKIQKLSKNKINTPILTFSTENSSAHIQIINYSDFNNKLWFLWKALFFIISLFGIFDSWAKNKSLCVVLDTKLELSENCKFIFRLKTPKANQEYAEIQSENKFEIITNTVYQNDKIKKRIKIFNIFKILTYVAIVALIAVLIIF